MRSNMRELLLDVSAGRILKPLNDFDEANDMDAMASLDDFHYEYELKLTPEVSRGRPADARWMRANGGTKSRQTTSPMSVLV